MAETSYVVTPQTNIRLIKSPLTLDNKNQLTFTDATAQYNYFSSLPYLECEDNTYQRKDGFIRYPGQFDTLLGYNYCMYQNEAFSNKWFYAYITDIKMLNNDVSAVYIKTDVFQTWQFDIVYKDSFVEREHVFDDTIGKNLVPENVELGDYVCNSHTLDTNINDLSNDLTYVVSSAANLWIIDAVTDKYINATPTYYNGIMSGCQYFKFDTASSLQSKLQDVSSRGQIDAINGLFIAPKTLATTTGASPSQIDETNIPVTYLNGISKQLVLNTYSPKNKKLLTYPYNYLLVSNNNGNASIYKYEEFSTTECQFKVDMCLTPGCSIRMIPKNYKGVTDNDEEGINLGKYPICSYPVDMYTNWLTQNSVNIPGIGKVSGDDLNLFSNVFGSTIGALGGATAGNYVASATYLASGFTGISNALIQKRQHELIPPESRGNLNAGDVVTASSKNTFHFYAMSIKKEFAQIIDDYFDMFGYQVNALKVPNLTSRPYWNFVKTIGCNLLGNIPQADLQELKNMFDSGVTLWHTTTYFLDYSKNNAVPSS